MKNQTYGIVLVSNNSTTIIGNSSYNLIEDFCHLKELYHTKSSAILFTNIFTCIFNVIFALTAACGNSLAMYVILRNRRLHNNANFLLLSLAFTDVMVGVLVQPLHVIYGVKGYFGVNSSTCDIFMLAKGFGFLFSGVSFLTLGLISCERYYTIFHAFQHNTFISTTKLLTVTALVWLTWTILVASNFWDIAQSKSLFFRVLCVSIIVIVLVFSGIIYFKIFKTARKHSIQIATQEDSSNNSHNKRVSREMRTSLTMFLVLTSLYCCYIPVVYVLLSNAMIGYRVHVRFIAYPWASLIIYINSSMNPLIYCYRQKDIRSAIIQIYEKFQ